MHEEEEGAPPEGGPQRYERLGKIGEGAFGEVAAGLDRRTGRVVAIKSVGLGGDLENEGLPRAALRELRALRLLEGHAHVVRLLDAFPQGPHLALVLEYLPSDLEQVIRRSPRLLPAAHVKGLLLQLLRGVRFLHGRRVLHRDLKPANLLLSAGGVLKIADLGSARVMGPHHRPRHRQEEEGDGDGPEQAPRPEREGETYTTQVATRWYRAPELLLGARRYGPGVDLWAAGCIFAELASLRPLFPGSSDVDQLFRIVRVLGPPTPARWPSVVELPDFDKVAFPDSAPLPLPLAFPRVPAQAQPLLGRLVQLDPSQRPSAAKALGDEWFCLLPLPSDPSELPVPPRPLPGLRKKSRTSGSGDGEWDGWSDSWLPSDDDEGGAEAEEEVCSKGLKV